MIEQLHASEIRNQSCFSILDLVSGKLMFTSVQIDTDP